MSVHNSLKPRNTRAGRATFNQLFASERKREKRYGTKRTLVRPRKLALQSVAKPGDSSRDDESGYYH